jgi:hypothetical protein
VLAGRRLATLTILLGGFAAFAPLSMDLYLPAFPNLADDLDTTAAAVQLTLTADVVELVVGQLVAVGCVGTSRAAPVVDGGLCCCIGAVRARPSVLVLIGWRFLQGLSGGRCRHRAGSGRRPDQRGVRRPAVLAVHDAVERCANRCAGRWRRTSCLDGELAADVLAARRDQRRPRGGSMAVAAGELANGAAAPRWATPDRPPVRHPDARPRLRGIRVDGGV